jgi:hypothetical protein
MAILGIKVPDDKYKDLRKRLKLFSVKQGMEYYLIIDRWLRIEEYKANLNFDLNMEDLLNNEDEQISRNYIREVEIRYIDLMEKAVDTIDKENEMSFKNIEKAYNNIAEKTRILYAILKRQIDNMDSEYDYPEEASSDKLDEEIWRFQMGESICKLRKQNLSYSKIADMFIHDKIPTLSGRGKWRAAAVSRLEDEYLDWCESTGDERLMIYKKKKRVPPQ